MSSRLSYSTETHTFSHRLNVIYSREKREGKKINGRKSEKKTVKEEILFVASQTEHPLENSILMNGLCKMESEMCRMSP